MQGCPPAHIWYVHCRLTFNSEANHLDIVGFDSKWQQSHPTMFVFDTKTAIQDLGYGCAVTVVYGLPDCMYLAAGRCHIATIGAILPENCHLLILSFWSLDLYPSSTVIRSDTL